MSHPDVSVVIPVYNRRAYVEQAVRSALGQTISPLEVVVVDDGSTDGSAEAAESVPDSRVKVLRREHEGAPAARNAGVGAARGEFVLWLDSDDVLEQGAVSAYSEALADFPKAEVLHGKLTITYPDLTPMETLLGRDWYNRNFELMRELVFDNPITNGGTMVKRACYDRVGGYDRSFPRAHDYEFWTRLAPKARFKYVRSLVARYRWHETNITGGAVLPDRTYDLRVVLAHLERSGVERLFPELVSGSKERCEEVIGRIEARLRELGSPGVAENVAGQLRERFTPRG